MISIIFLIEMYLQIQFLEETILELIISYEFGEILEINFVASIYL